MENKVFKQKQLKPSVETGSFINMLMSNNSSTPEVGNGATILSWTDRHAYEVMSVSDDYKRVVIQQYLPERIDNLGMSESQDYKYEKLNGRDETLVWKWNSWRRESKYITWDDLYEYDKSDDSELFDDNACLQLVKGKTKMVTEYPKVSIIFGIKQEYYDYSF